MQKKSLKPQPRRRRVSQTSLRVLDRLNSALLKSLYALLALCDNRYTAKYALSPSLPPSKSPS